MNKKALLMGLWMVLLISFVSAWEFDNVATNWNAVDNSLDIVDGYGLGDTVAHIKLVENTDQALINGRAVFEITLYEDYTEGVVDGTDFVDRSGEAVGMVGSWSYLDNRSYVVQIPNYENICGEVNGTYTCWNNITNYNNTLKWVTEWKNYVGEDMVSGNYKFKIEAKKQQMEDVDFIPELFGVELPQWAWWNTSWNTRKKIFVNENGNYYDLINYSINLTIPYEDGMQNDFDDLRFTNFEASEELGYWIESHTDGVTANIWVKFPNISKSTTTDFYMYFNNSLATNNSDRNEGMLLYDDFSVDTIGSVWQCFYGSWIITGGYLIQSVDNAGGGQHCNTINNFTQNGFIVSTKYKSTSNDGAAPDVSWATVVGNSEPVGSVRHGSGASIGHYRPNTYDFFGAYWLPYAQHPGLVSGIDWHIDELRWFMKNSTYVNATGKIDGNQPQNFSFENATVGYPGILSPTWDGKKVFDVGTDHANGWFDWIEARAYVEPEPSYSFGSTEVIGVDIVLTNPAGGGAVPLLNANFSCELNVYGFNLTNANLTIYNPDNTTDHIETWNWLSSDNIISFNVSYIHNFTDGGWRVWGCTGVSDQPSTTQVNQTFFVDSYFPNLTLYNPILEGDSASARLDFLVQDVFPDKCFYSLDGSTNVTLGSCSSNTTFNAGSYGSHSFSFYANDTVGNLNETHRDFLVIEKISETYEASVIETTTQTFDIVLDDTTNLEPAVTLKYDNTDYSGTLVGTSGTQKTYRTIFNMGNVSIGTSETRHFNWTMSGSVDGNAGSYTFPTNSQTVSALIIVPTNDTNAQICDDVSATLHMVNYTFLNEETDDTINGINLTAYYKVWVETESNYVEKSWVETHSSASTYPVCLFPNDASIYADVKLIYGGEGDYAIREFNLQGQIFNNQTQEYNLYMANDTDTSTITITVQESSGIELVDYLVKAIKVNYGNASNLEYEVESHITDGNGQTIFELYPEDYYYFEVWKDGVLKHTESPPAIVTGDFTITVSLQTIFDPNVEAEIEANVISSLSYNNNTGNITTTWSDSMGLINQACLRVWNGTSGSSNPFSNSCDGNLSGTLSQNIGNYTGMIFYSGLFVTSVEDGIEYKIESLDVDLREGWQVFSREGLLWGGVVATTTIALLAVPSPTAVITVGIATFAVLGYVLNIFSIGWGVFVFIAFLGIVFIIYMRD
tara:strand:- start:2366 stop:5926 length:3561 start_codon:yes stop_codon:yes gene_type:complete